MTKILGYFLLLRNLKSLIYNSVAELRFIENILCLTELNISFVRTKEN